MATGRQRTCCILLVFLAFTILLAALFAYAQYLTLKKNLITRVSDNATSLIGQRVEIGDVFLGPSAGITIAGIRIRNPEDFGPGDLISIRNIHLNIRYRDLFRGRFSFRGVGIDAPELSLLTGKDGRLNISETFRTFLSKKGTARYRIDELTITGGGFSFNQDTLSTIREINIILKDLSSDAGVRSLIKASLVLPGGNMLTADGWASLREEPKKFSISASSGDMDLAFLGERLRPYGMEIEKTRGSLTIRADGDTVSGFGLHAGMRIRTSGLRFLKKDGTELSLTSDAFFEPSKDLLTVSNMDFRMGDASAVLLKGVVRDLSQNPSYTAEMKIDRLDLSAFTLVKGLQTGGIISSDTMRVSGDLSSSFPGIIGTAAISDGSLNMAATAIRKLNGRVKFSSGREMTARAEATATVLRAGSHEMKQPVDMYLAAEGKGSPLGMDFSSRLLIPRINADLRGKGFSLDGLDLSFIGTARRKTVNGKASFAAKSLSYGGRTAKDIRASLGLDHDGKKTVLRDLIAGSDLLSAAADMITATTLRKSTTDIDIENLSLTSHEKKSGLRGVDCALSFTGAARHISGSGVFSIGNIILQDILTGPVSGKGSFDRNSFSVDVSSADLFRGAVRLSARGSAGDGPLAVTLDATAEHLDLALATKAVTSFMNVPFGAAGQLSRLKFNGTIGPEDNITGSASLDGKGIAITDARNRTLLKDMLVRAGILLKGNDLEFRGDASAGNMKADMSGTVERYAGPDRSLRLSLTVPEVKANDIRTAFWDVVPDRLLYVGLEGSIALDLNAAVKSDAVTADGTLLVKKISIEGENGEYSVGPVDGSLPFHFRSKDESAPVTLPSIERADFDKTKKAFAEPGQNSGNEFRIGSIRYGFRLLEDVSLWIAQNGRILNISRLSAKMFGGRVFGAASVDLSGGPDYRAGLLVDRISLTRLCEDIPTIRGYISGKVDGSAVLRGSGADLAKMTGTADFWTYGDREEKTRISREFLEKIGGPQVRAYLGERRFSKGVMSLFIKNGFFIFRELEISNRNLFGITDLSVKVAPLNNRIAIDHLMWTITEAAQRAKKD